MALHQIAKWSFSLLSGCKRTTTEFLTWAITNTRKWERLYTYGGKFAENITQAVARDVLATTMPLIESSGYEIALTVHDEVITEADDVPEYNHEHLSSLLATNPEWALGCL